MFVEIFSKRIIFLHQHMKVDVKKQMLEYKIP